MPFFLQAVRNTNDAITVTAKSIIEIFITAFRFLRIHIFFTLAGTFLFRRGASETNFHPFAAEIFSCLRVSANNFSTLCPRAADNLSLMRQISSSTSSVQRFIFRFLRIHFFFLRQQRLELAQAGLDFARLAAMFLHGVKGFHGLASFGSRFTIKSKMVCAFFSAASNSSRDGIGSSNPPG